MEVQFVKLNPTENMTILVESPAERSQYPEIATRLMAYGSVYAEQTGFIEAPSDPAAWARLQMAGGEFCGNAAMSLAAYLVWQRQLSEGVAAVTVPCGTYVPLEVSGAPGLVECTVIPREEVFRCTLGMPLPELIETLSLPFGGSLRELTAVRFPGITHVIVPVETIGGDGKLTLKIEPNMKQSFMLLRGYAEQAAVEWETVIGADAFGVILFTESGFRIDPLVKVKSPSSMMWERGCGSGSAAVGAYLADRSRTGVKLPLAQAGGVIEVNAQWDGTGRFPGRVSALSITGTVRVVARGTAYI
jgi:diaminopimelate epimerase